MRFIVEAYHLDRPSLRPAGIFGTFNGALDCAEKVGERERPSIVRVQNGSSGGAQRLKNEGFWVDLDPVEAGVYREEAWPSREVA